jgi:hypothetical protein
MALLPPALDLWAPVQNSVSERVSTHDSFTSVYCPIHDPHWIGFAFDFFRFLPGNNHVAYTHLPSWFFLY